MIRIRDMSLIRIRNMSLGTRATNALLTAGIETLAQLNTKSWGDIAEIPNIGELTTWKIANTPGVDLRPETKQERRERLRLRRERIGRYPRYRG